VLRFLRNPGDLGFEMGSTLAGIAGLAGTLVLSMVVGVRLSVRLTTWNRSPSARPGRRRKDVFTLTPGPSLGTSIWRPCW
jgi:hypothetical protein